MDFDDDFAKTVFKYKFTDNDEMIHATPREFKEHFDVVIKGEPGDIVSINNRSAKYCGFEPKKITQTTLTEFEKNGRVGLRVVQKDGSVQYISKTKVNYCQTGKVVHSYTKEFHDHLVRTGNHEMIHSDTVKGNAKITRATSEEVKNDH